MRLGAGRGVSRRTELSGIAGSLVAVTLGSLTRATSTAPLLLAGARIFDGQSAKLLQGRDVSKANRRLDAKLQVHRMFNIHRGNHATSSVARDSMPKERANRFAILLFSLLVLGASSGFATTSNGEVLGNIAASAVLLAGLASMYRKRILLIVGIVLLVPAMAARWTFFWLQAWELAPVSIIFSLLFTTFNAAALFVYIQRRGSPTNDTVYGGICVYVLLGYCFALVFMLLEILTAGSFYFTHGNPVSITQIESQLIYFSFSTLTTVGFGDITPLTQPAKALAMIEAVVGPMFVAVFLARLVGIRTSSG